ncbi:MAG: tRNA pseudouridine(38-40) synthase TruA [Dysgonamonadaceae bacterium]|jgi:tRNA pseudouridine38-40 synthase|nr:tRNA pseudouridine(38-40) synthase TruA [Dysgonamonadaceae bacterium]
MKRYFILLAYNGKNYCGWQIQPNGMTVQEKIEQSLSLLLRSPISVTGAGRTDTGVHARKMVAHFDYGDGDLNPETLTGKLNRILPPDIAIYSIVPVPQEAHARFDAVSRTYKYYLTQEKNPFYYETAYLTTHPLDFDRMNLAAALLPEYTDFTSFSKLHTDVKTNNCRVTKAEWKKENEYWVFTIEANRFLRNMVRAIVGTLLEVGRGKLSVAGFRKVIESKDRGNAGTSAPAHALFLHEIEYTKELRIKN